MWLEKSLSLFWFVPSIVGNSDTRQEVDQKYEPITTEANYG